MKPVILSGRMLAAAAIAVAVSLSSCGDRTPASDAFGTFEAGEVIISAQAAGQLLAFDAPEGQRLAAGHIVGVIDTTQLALQRRALQAQRRAVHSRIAGVEAQVAVLEEQRRIAHRERERVRSLVGLDAASQKQADEVDDQIAVLGRQIVSVRTQTRTVEHEVAAIDAQIAQVSEQIGRSLIVNPVEGVVLTSYAEPYELASPGKPLYKIGDLDTLYLRAYVRGDQLHAVQPGRGVHVLFDAGGGEIKTLPGRISWVASEAEFTPRFIQTREERVNLVYAVKVRVGNDGGMLKIGMPGEVRF